MRFSVLSIHPEIVRGICSAGIMRRAIDKGLIELNLVQIRDFAEPPHHRVDEKPYGGGPGMVMTCKPIVDSLKSLGQPSKKRRVVVLAAKGKKFSQKMAKRWTKYEEIVLICGRYEGIDERVREFYADEEVRIGDYVLMGGEVAAGVIIETMGRLIPEVLGNPTSLSAESFSESLISEYPQYSRPPVFDQHKVPEVLLSGDHQKIDRWRQQGSALKKKESR